MAAGKERPSGLFFGKHPPQSKAEARHTQDMMMMMMVEQKTITFTADRFLSYEKMYSATYTRYTAVVRAYTKYMFEQPSQTTE